MPMPSIESRTAAGMDSGVLLLRRPAAQVFAARGQVEPSEIESRFMTDFLSEFGMEFDPRWYAEGGGNCFTLMSQALLDGLDRPLPALDVALLAYHLPDMEVVEVAGCYLAERCPGDPAVFSVSGQGVGAPFTALRILSCMRMTGVASGAVFVLDQSTIPYWDADTHGGMVRDCAVLLCAGTTSDGADDAVVDFLDEQPVADPADTLEKLARRSPGVRIVVGHVLADRLDAEFRVRHNIITGPQHHLCTSAWAALAEHWPRDQYTVVADYDPHAGRMFQVGLRPGVEP